MMVARHEFLDGSTIMGTPGTGLIDRDGYEIYDLKGDKKSELKAGDTSSSADLIGRDSMTDLYFANFMRGNPQRRKAQRSCLHRQPRRDDAATL
jgi:hypothetical protein